MYKDFINRPIFITGVERSGSSIIAKIIQYCGAWAGDTTEKFENIKIKQLVNSLYVQRGFDINGQFPIPNTEDILIPNNWGGHIDDYLMRERFSGENLWMYKNHRICQIWPIWNYAYPDAKWIIVRRRTGDIISSCMKTAYMSAFKNKQNQQLINVKNEQEGWLWWVHEHEKLFVGMIENGLNCKVIWPERMAIGDFAQIYEMLKWLDLPWRDDIPGLVSPLFDKSLQRERRK